MYRGDRPGYHACDTAYHDIQHVLEVTLAMARLIDGYERARMGLEPLDAAMFRLGVITALFHDCGYIRTLDDRQHKNGGELTLTHVSRGARFLRDYLPKIGMGEVADVSDRKSTRLNSSHLVISYAVFCLKKKKNNNYSSLAQLHIKYQLVSLTDIITTHRPNYT